MYMYTYKLVCRVYTRMHACMHVHVCIIQTRLVAFLELASAEMKQLAVSVSRLPSWPSCYRYGVRNRRASSLWGLKKGWLSETLGPQIAPSRYFHQTADGPGTIQAQETAKSGYRGLNTYQYHLEGLFEVSGSTARLGIWDQNTGEVPTLDRLRQSMLNSTVKKYGFDTS